MHKKPISISLERLETILEASNEGWWEWDVLSNQTYHSPLWYHLLGYEFTEFPSTFKAWVENLHPEDRTRSIEEQAKAMQSDDQWEIEFRMQHKAGHYKWFRSRGRVVKRDPEGQALKVIGTHQDISKQKELEADLAAQKERLDLLEGIISVSQESFNIYDFIHQRLSYSSILEKEELVNDPLQHLIYSEDVEKVQRHLRRLKKAKRSETIQCKFRVKTPEGGLKWISVQDRVYKRNAEGEVTQVIGSAIDIQNFVLQQERLTKMVNRLEKVSFQNAHHIRGPVATILSIIQLIKKEELVNQAQNPDLSMLLESLEKTIIKLDEVIHSINDHLGEED